MTKFGEKVYQFVVWERVILYCNGYFIVRVKINFLTLIYDEWHV